MRNLKKAAYNDMALSAIIRYGAFMDVVSGVAVEKMPDSTDISAIPFEIQILPAYYDPLLSAIWTHSRQAEYLCLKLASA